MKPVKLKGLAGFLMEKRVKRISKNDLIDWGIIAVVVAIHSLAYWERWLK
jgi:hypothetical protein